MFVGAYDLRTLCHLVVTGIQSQTCLIYIIADSLDRLSYHRFLWKYVLQVVLGGNCILGTLGDACEFGNVSLHYHKWPPVLW